VRGGDETGLESHGEEPLVLELLLLQGLSQNIRPVGLGIDGLHNNGGWIEVFTEPVIVHCDDFGLGSACGGKNEGRLVVGEDSGDVADRIKV